MKKVDLAWAAGVFDGEGCVAITRVPAAKQRGCLTDRYTVVVKVAMCHLPTVRRFFDLFATGTVQRGMARSNKCNASYAWLCQARLAATVLEQMRPYLVTKAEEADVALKFMKLPLALTGGHGGNKVTSAALLEQRLGLYWLLRTLKSRWRFYKVKMTNRDKIALRKAVAGMMSKRT